MQKTIKTRDILNCHSPILTCILICEFIKEIGDIRVRHQSMCYKLIEDLTNFCKNIQISNPNEDYIRFIMTQKDLSRRTVFQIAAENSFYMILHSPEIGTIVKKMWNGRYEHEAITSSGSIYEFLEDSNTKFSNPFLKINQENFLKSYFYQFSLWKESCSMRYWPESISTVCLITIFNLYIYFLVDSDQVMSNFTDLLYHTKILLYTYIAWSFCILCNLINNYIFCTLTKRKFILDIWGSIDILNWILSLFLFLNTDKFFGVENRSELIESTSLSSFSLIVRCLILSFNDICVWLRITGILLTFKNIGPLIRMISLLSLQTAKYLVVYALYIICFSAIFTEIFYNDSEQFTSFSKTITTLFGGFINNLNTFDFDKYSYFGAIMLLFYVTLSGIMLVNLLIALLSNVYRALSIEVDASHRSVLISFNRRYKWNKEYGFLILLTTPFNIINFFVLPIFFLLRRKYSLRHLNLKISKIYFLIFYFPFMILLSVIYNLCLIPLAYLKGIIYSFVNEKNHKSDFCQKVLNFFKWIFFGVLFLFYILLRDVYFMCSSVFFSFDTCSSEISRIKKFMKTDDVITFLQFIHKRSREDRNDLHTLFIDFLLYEQEKKVEIDEEIKEKTYYLDKINNAGNQKSHKYKKKSSSYFVIHGKKESNNNNIYMGSISENTVIDSDPTLVSGIFVKRNIIIIEILENFLIDDGSDNYIIDIEKLKMLLPMTFNIDNSYIKRLVYTDITSLNRAINKLKRSKNLTLKEQLVNKIETSMAELDNFIDNIEVNKLDLGNHHLEKHLKNNTLDHLKNDIYYQDKDYERKQFYDDYIELLYRTLDNVNQQQIHKTPLKNNSKYI